VGVAMPSRGEIRRRLLDSNDVFSIRPLPSSKSIGTGSVDLAIGTAFLPAEPSSLPSLRLAERGLVAPGRIRDTGIQPLFGEVRVHPKGTFVMQPRQFVLTATFEYISMPYDLAGLIQSRSTFGRMGIIAATAAYVAPGFKGCPTLEVVNAGEVPIELEPYQQICQIVLLSANEPEISTSRYHLSTRPRSAKVDDPFS
jgi:dCTP deaminase